MKEALRASERRLAHAQQTAKLGGWELDLESGAAWWSDELCALLGLDPETTEPNAEGFLARVHADDIEFLRSLFARTFADGTPVDGVEHPLLFRLSMPDGSVRVMESRTDPLGRGQPHIVTGTILDVTERVEAERLARDAEETYRTILAAVQNPITVWDPETLRPLYANAPALENLGYSWEEFERLAPEEIVHADDYGQSPGVWDAVQHGGPVPNFQRRHVTKAGEVRTAQVSVAVYPDRSGILVEWVDITDTLRVREQLLQAQKSEALGTLVAGVAHDFNNLLTAISGSIYMASRRPARRDHWLRSAEEATSRAADVVRQLLQFSRREEPQRRAIDLAEVARGTLRLVGETFDRRIDLQLRTSEQSAARADRVQVEMVLMNLLTNARDAVVARADQAPGEPGYRPQITVAIGGGPRPRGDNGDNGDDYVELIVSDNGAGMSAETRERIFDPFFTTKPADGTGLGLSTAYGIVGEHGGTITVESEPGAGATFTVRLPAARGERPAGHTPLSPGDAAYEGAELDRPAVLLVDDEETLLEFETEVLIEAGYRVSAATDGEAALLVLAEGEFDLVLLDVNMPTLNGRQTLERIGEDDAAPPVLLVSGYVSERDAVERGACGLLEKPFDAPALLKAVRAALAAPIRDA